MIFIYSYSTGSASSCSACAVGNYCNLGIMTPCSAGTYQSQTSMTSCTNCPTGSYCAYGSVSPTLCPDGYISNAGTQLVSACTKCPVGNYCVGGGKNVPN